MATYDARPSAFTQLSTTADWESFMSSAGIWDGVDGSGSFTPSLDTPGRNAVIGAGQGIIKGQLWRCDASVSTAIPAASAQNRLDRLVLRLNRGATSSPNVVIPTVITGTPSGSPTLPPLQQTPTGLYDVPISYWTSTSAGAITGLIDQRQYAGRSVISMLSTARPTPANPVLGIETDTGYALAFQNNVWTYLPYQQAVQGGNTNNTTSMNAMHAAFPIPANDAKTATWYRLKAGGHGTQAATTAVNLNFQLFAFGNNWGTSSDSGNIPAGAGFHWEFEGTLIVAGANGAASFFGKMSISQTVANAPFRVIAMDSQVASGTNMAATNAVMQASWASVTNAPTLVCTGATWERGGVI